MAGENKAVVRRVIEEIVNGGNLALADTLVAPSYVYHGPGGLEFRGPEGFRQLVSVYRTAFPDLRLTIDDIIAEDDKVVVRWTGRGTHRGDLAGIAPTGRSTTVTGMIISRLAEGKVVEDFESFDELELLRQLGVTAIPAAAHA